MTPIKAIRAKCLDCVAGQVVEVRLCPSSDCPLYPFRMGHNPNFQKMRSQRTKKEAIRQTGVTMPTEGEKGK